MIWGNYKLDDPDTIETPSLLIFEDALDHNIRKAVELAGSAQNLMLHVKTHKSADILKRLMNAGITSFKCATLKESEMTAQAGAASLVLAYPIAQLKKALRFAHLQCSFPKTNFFTVVSSSYHVNVLSRAAIETGTTISVMLDLDVGLHRTGIAPDDQALTLARMISKTPGLNFAGLHAYDGQNDITDLKEREAAARNTLRMVIGLKNKLIETGLKVSYVVMGGTACFPYYAKEPGVAASPGTIIYWDAGYSKIFPDMPFRFAALVLTQVVDSIPSLGLVTLDLGSKSISADKDIAKRAVFIGYPDIEIVRQNEEHTVVKPGSHALSIGDYLLAVPAHVCTAVIHYPGALLINKHGHICGSIEHTARNRI